jgi:hypothetical protein
MSQQELLKRVVQVLETAGIEYMLTGSVVSSLQGDEPFDQSRFARRYIEALPDLNLKVSTPEDTILAKLRWAKLAGGSEKQFTDALRVYEVQFGQLDLVYLEQWVKKLKLESLWKRLTNEAEIT